MIDKLVANIRKTNAPVVVGLDPMLSYVPEALTRKAFAEYGETLEGAAEAIWQFNKAIVDAVYDLIPAVKPQIAMYEQYGIPGMQVFERTVQYCQDKGLVVIGDIKRGDIGSTSKAYAAGHLGSVKVGSKVFSAFHEDSATVNPYMGSDCVNPFLDVCREEGKGIFVLVKTSNPSSGEFQDRQVLPEYLFMDNQSECGSDVTKPLYEVVGEKVNEWAESLMGKCGYSEVGAVVGATYPAMGAKLRSIMPKSYILVPGYGAQGGKAEDLGVFFNEDGLGAIVNSSRGIICAYTKEPYKNFGPDNFADASRKAVEDMIADINGALGH
ncbi:MAG: orotidine-5'-phosphate decarboxylase [Eubacterium sp.]|nr:orotidine-5'-phosphate decarboxylase [Eubacterium sp.]